MIKDISSRKDVMRLVKSFYVKVREDDMLGPVFNSIIKDDEEWEKHFEKLTDFWETNLFFLAKYKGNPMLVHQQVDAKMGKTIDQNHFNRWLHLWQTTVDELFEGEKADLAKRNANNIATFMFRKIDQAK